MRALVIGASGQVGAALLRVLRARGHEAARHLGAPRRARASCRSTSPIPPRVERARRRARAPTGCSAPPRSPTWTTARSTRTRPSRSNRDGPARRRAGRRPRRRRLRLLLVATTSSTAWAAPMPRTTPPRPLGVYGRSKCGGRAGGAGRAAARAGGPHQRGLRPRAPGEELRLPADPRLPRAARASAPRWTSARAPPTTRTWPPPPWSAASGSCAASGTWPAPTCSTASLRAPGLPRCSTWTARGSRPRPPPQLGQKAAAPARRRARRRQGAGAAQDAAAGRRGGAPRDAGGARGAGAVAA